MPETLQLAPHAHTMHPQGCCTETALGLYQDVAVLGTLLQQEQLHQQGCWSAALLDDEHHNTEPS